MLASHANGSSDSSQDQERGNSSVRHTKSISLSPHTDSLPILSRTENMRAPRASEPRPGSSDSSQEQDQEQRSSHKGGSTGSGSIRHTEFWLHDGSIVLSVQDTLFKVHQTILSNHSEVFADLFNLPQPPPNGDLGMGLTKAGADVVDGCNVVHLHDSSDDFVNLLRAIYYPSHFDNLPPHADLDTLLVFIGGILRLSTKYLVRALRKRCIALLTSRFPTTYQEYLALTSPPASTSSPLAISYSSSGSPSTAPATPSAPTTPLGITTPVAAPATPPAPASPRTKHRTKHKPSSIMRAMTLAQHTNVPLILPYASYLLARTSPQRLLAHTPASISWHQKTITLVGREQLRLAEMALTHAFLLAFRPAAPCGAPGLCGRARGPHAEWHVLEGGSGGRGRGPDPLRAYGRWERMNVCVECVAAARGEHERGREEVWERLPGFFEMGGWAELRAAQES